MTIRTLALGLALASLGATEQAPAPSPTATLIRNALLVDGTGAPARRADVRIRGDRVVQVGQLQRAQGDRVTDANGLALAPGFIDTHSHHDRGLDTAPDALAMVSQGVTTIVVGQDGGGSNLTALFSGLDSHPAAVNVASYAGHGAIRRAVMGKNFARPATSAEIERMKALLRREMAAGALGLSTGLEYDPGIYSTREEVLTLAKIAGDAGGRYMSHLRSEDRSFWDALDEIVAIGRVNKMPVQVSHLKLGMHDLWGQADKAIAILDRARAAGVQITADVYPYTYWQSNLGVLYPKRNFSDAAETSFVLGHVSLPDDIIFNSFRAHPDYVGKTLADVARIRAATPEQTLMALLAEPGGESTGIVAKGMADADVERLMQWPFANVCSDGQSFGLHPRGFGSFAKVLGPYVRDRKLFSLEDAVRKMTSLAAADVGLLRRGRVAPNFYADLVLFDPAAVADRADFGKAQAQAVGIHTVWVNGQVVFQDGQTTGVHPGRPLRRQKTAQAASTAERGTLPARWTAAKSDCTNAPPFFAHEYNQDLFIIRQSGCTNFEKPFLYLLFGSAQTMLVDTGARGADASGIVDELRRRHASRQGSPVLPLVVVHSHGHGDHTAGDAALARLSNARVIEAKPDRVAEFFGIQNWPREPAQYDLGGRILDIVPIPGHEPASIAIYDRRTAVLLTGDTLYPGRLYVRDPAAFRDSIDRLADFTATRNISHVLGAHIENTRTPYRDYPEGTTYQPEEHVLELARSNLMELREALHQMGDHLERRAYPDFTVWPVEAR